ncbi:hypothetical protein D3C77_532710 [compost metagenome]
MQWGFLAWLDHHRTACCQRRGQFADQLVQRVVPGVDERTDTDGLAIYQGIADLAYLVHQAGQFDVLFKAGNRPVYLYATAPLNRHSQLGVMTLAISSARIFSCATRA